MTIAEIIICAIGALWLYLMMGALCVATMWDDFEGCSYWRVMAFLFWPIFFAFIFITLPFWLVFYDNHKKTENDGTNRRGAGVPER